jgi:hypothetical protein
MMTTNGTKYTFVCDPDECDTLIEVTCVSGFDFPNGVIKHTCPCGRQMAYISATILTSNQPTKEETMETYQLVPESYNPNLLVTYKRIDGDVSSYPVEKVKDIEWSLEESRRMYKTLSEKQNSWYTKESKLRSLLEEVYEDSSEQEVLSQIAEIFDIPLTKEVEYTAWIRVDMTVEVELGGDLDIISDFISSNLTVDSYDSMISINNHEIDRVEEGAY